MIKKQILKNNVVLITQDMDSTKTASVGFYFATGSRFESSGEKGISHFTEHMLFKGTRNRSNRDIAVIFDRMGGMVNACTERENVNVFYSIPLLREDAFELALDVVCDLSTNCNFPADEFEKERNVVINEILSVEDDPEDSSMDELARSIWPDQSLSDLITGTVDDVEKITRDQMIEWYDKYFVHGELVVVAAGVLDYDVLLSKLESLPMKKTAVEFFRHAHFNDSPKWNSVTSFSSSKFNQDQVFTAYPLDCKLSFKDYLSLLVFDSASGDSMSSRLFTELREKLGLCYNVGSFFTIYENSGLWCAFLVCDRKNAVLASQKLCSIIEDCATSGLTQEEIDVAIERIAGSELMNDGAASVVVRRLWNFYSMGYELMDTDGFIQCIREVDKNDIMEFVRKLVVPGERTVFVYGSRLSGRDKKSIRKISQVEK